MPSAAGGQIRGVVPGVTSLKITPALQAVPVLYADANTPSASARGRHMTRGPPVKRSAAMLDRCR